MNYHLFAYNSPSGPIFYPMFHKQLCTQNSHNIMVIVIRQYVLINLDENTGLDQFEVSHIPTLGKQLCPKIGLCCTLYINLLCNVYRGCTFCNKYNSDGIKLKQIGMDRIEFELILSFTINSDEGTSLQFVLPRCIPLAGFNFLPCQFNNKYYYYCGTYLIVLLHNSMKPPFLIF